jgi:hypothetical protein
VKVRASACTAPTIWATWPRCASPVEVDGVSALNVDGEVRELDPARFVTGERRVRVVAG